MIIKSNQIEAARLMLAKPGGSEITAHAYLLNGNLIATNGHAMLVQKIGEQDNIGLQIDVHGIVKNSAIDTGLFDPRLSLLDNEQYNLLLYKFNKLIPKSLSGETAQFDSALLEKITKAAKFLYVGVGRLKHNGSGAAFMNLGDSAYVVIMPLRLPEEVEYIKPVI